eukprot:m.106142 g.106142  ORF g.106142 m.106142 type:complete len:311 (+) comp37252_c0_seq4:709-1641(+)
MFESTVRCMLSQPQIDISYILCTSQYLYKTCLFIRRCVEIKTKQDYAVKIISRRGEHSREVQVFRLCQGHPNIVKLVDVFHDELHFYVVMELCRGGELLQRIRRKKNFTEKEASVIMKKLLDAARFLHEKRVVHRDLKPENLLFADDREDSEVKIADFGFARLLPENRELTTPCFTLQYAAPEVLHQFSLHQDPVLRTVPDGYDESCDLWSLGVILYTMLSGRAPFQALNASDPNESSAKKIIDRIKAGKVTFIGNQWDKISHNAKDLIKGTIPCPAYGCSACSILVEHLSKQCMNFFNIYDSQYTLAEL